MRAAAPGQPARPTSCAAAPSPCEPPGARRNGGLQTARARCARAADYDSRPVARGAPSGGGGAKTQEQGGQPIRGRALPAGFSPSVAAASFSNAGATGRTGREGKTLPERQRQGETQREPLTEVGSDRDARTRDRERLGDRGPGALMADTGGERRGETHGRRHREGRTRSGVQTQGWTEVGGPRTGGTDKERQRDREIRRPRERDV